MVGFFHDLLNIQDEIKGISEIDEFDANYINLVDVLPISVEDFKFGQVFTLSGDDAYRYIEKAIEWAMKDKIKGVVTAPLNKESLHMSGHYFDGHTEIFAKLTNTKKYEMMLWSEKLKVIHVSLRETCNRVKKGRVLETILLADTNLKNMGIANPMSKN